MTEPTIISTICKYCVLAERDDTGQTGCKLGRIDKYRARGINVEKLEDQDYFTIDTYCAACRNDGWKHAKDSDSVQKKAVLEEIQIKYSVIVNCEPSNGKSDVKKLKKTLISIKKQSPRPEEIIVIGWFDKPAEVTTLLNEVCPKQPWRFIRRLDDKSTLITTKPYFAVINEAVSKMPKNMYYLHVNTGYIVDPNFVSNIVKFVNIELNPLLLAIPVDDDYNGLFCWADIHVQSGGFRAKDLITKITAKFEEESCLHLIRKMSEIQTFHYAQ